VSRELLVLLSGGIGNQLFQIAAGALVAEYTDLKLVFNVDAFKSDSFGRSSIVERLFPDCAVDSRPTSGHPIVQESDVDSNEMRVSLIAKISSLDSDCIIMRGYWQSNEFVTDEFVNKVRGAIQTCLTVEQISMARIIEDDPRAIGIHFRRADYFHHGIVSDSHYEAALDWIRGRFCGEGVYAFSDESNSVAHFLSRIPGQKYMVSSGSDMCDLLLLSRCKFHVIANSTFSWWGARLAESERVIYPLPWSKIHTPSTSLFPCNWVGLLGAFEDQPAADRMRSLEESNFYAEESSFFAGVDAAMSSYERGRWFCPGDATKKTSYDAHYLFHTAWAARRLFERPVDLHFDIGSDIRFVTISSCFQRMVFADYRPLDVSLHNLECISVDLNVLPFDTESIQSLSCMHVVEHIGLGRYGDKLDFFGHQKAMLELDRVLAPGGTLYFVVPVGRPSIQFHAHRVFSSEDVVSMFPSLELTEFSMVTDDGLFIERVNLSASENQNYACGCFLFTKQRLTKSA